MDKVLVIVCVLAVFPAAADPADATLDEIVKIARGGAPGLALRLLDRVQADQDLDVDAWSAAERERIHILAARGDWRALVDRGTEHPSGLPQGFMDWVAGQRARALVQLGDGRGARAVLAGAIWRTRPPDSAALREWRQTIIRSYLADGELEAALIALQRFKQDYGDDDPVQRTLHGEALLRAERPREALDVLGNHDSEPVRSLRWLAALRAGTERPGALFERAVRSGSASDTDPAARRAAWRVAAEAAERMENRGAAVAALERALAAGDDPGLPEVLRVAPRQLWDAYRDWGRALGNVGQLIVGLDQQWLDAAEAEAVSEPTRARALYAALAQDTRSPAIAEYAYYRISRSLRDDPGGDRLMAALFLRGNVFERPEDIPEPIRYSLIDEVLREGDIALASRLVADLDLPPADVDPAAWALRRARVLVLGGHREEGVDVLMALVSGDLDYDVDRLLQVVFDLQSVDAHHEALRVFEGVYAREDIEVQQRREILFWVADSYSALDEHGQAARLYLRSAGLEDTYAMDPWAQTARYRAAQSLADAGLRGDAVIILRALLNATRDPGRQAVLRHEIEQLSRLLPSDSERR